MPSETPPTDNVTPRRRFSWPVIVVLLLAGHTTLILGAVSLAVRGTGRGVVPDYYAQAIDFDARKQELADSEALGWTLTLSPDEAVEAKGQRAITATLHDHNGQPIDDAVVDVRLIRLSNGRIEEVVFSPRGELGGYHAVASLPAAGLYRAESTVQHGAKRFVQTDEVLVVGNAAPPLPIGGAS